MTYATLMVHMDVGSANDGVLHAAAAIAERFKVRVIGIAACQPVMIMASDGYTSGDVVEMDIAELAKETTEAEASFRTALQGKVADLTWRSVTANEQLADYIVREARAADLVITGPDQGWSAFDTSRRVIVSNLVLRAGRPVVIVPPEAPKPNLDSIVVAWKDTREARRAIADALPLLKQAGRVLVVEIAPTGEIAAARIRLEDVAGWLNTHGIASERSATVSTGDDSAELLAIARDRRAGVLVAGAYGHNRLREWVLGGVTRDLLVRPGCCSFVSY